MRSRIVSIMYQLYCALPYLLRLCGAALNPGDAEQGIPGACHSRISNSESPVAITTSYTLLEIHCHDELRTAREMQVQMIESL